MYKANSCPEKYSFNGSVLTSGPTKKADSKTSTARAGYILIIRNPINDTRVLQRSMLPETRNPLKQKNIGTIGLKTIFAGPSQTA